MLTLVYPAIFHKEDNSLWVEFPDLEGCQTFGGNTLPETMTLASEALSAYALTFLDENTPIPAPSDITSIQTDDGFVTLVACDISSTKNTKSVKKTLTVPQWLDARATAMGINFSQTLQEGLLAKIQRN